MSEKRERPDKGRWHLDPAEVVGGAESEGGGWLPLWLRHVPTGLEARARISPEGSGAKDQETAVREVKPLLWEELEEKAAWRLRVPGRKWNQSASTNPLPKKEAL